MNHKKIQCVPHLIYIVASILAACVNFAYTPHAKTCGTAFFVFGCIWSFTSLIGAINFGKVLNNHLNKQ